MIANFEKKGFEIIKINGVPFKAERGEAVGLNNLAVVVGTTGLCGGDASHGGRTYLALENMGCTNMNVTVERDSDGMVGKVHLYFGGDSELETLTSCLEFALKTLKSKIEPQRVGEPKTPREEIFLAYLSDVCELYRETGKLAGMSKIAEKYHITKITKSQFFEFNLHECVRKKCGLTKEFSDQVYAYVKSGSKGARPLWSDF